MLLEPKVIRDEGMKDKNNGKNISTVLRRQRTMMGLTLHELNEMTGVSSSHLGRIERGERFPSARTLGRIARPLGFDENELFLYAGFLSSSPAEDRKKPVAGELDPYVAMVLSQEPVETQRTVVGILSILKGIAREMDSRTGEAPE